MSPTRLVGSMHELAVRVRQAQPARGRLRARVRRTWEHSPITSRRIEGAFKAGTRSSIVSPRTGTHAQHARLLLVAAALARRNPRGCSGRDVKVHSPAPGRGLLPRCRVRGAAERRPPASKAKTPPPRSYRLLSASFAGGECGCSFHWQPMKILLAVAPCGGLREPGPARFHDRVTVGFRRIFV